jgi:hypothetical protein
VNKACQNKLCQKCCGNSIDHCSVTSHVKHKPAGYQSVKYKKTTSMEGDNTATVPPSSKAIPGVVDHLARAIREGQSVHVVYTNRDPNKNRSRKIKPLEWVCYSENIKVICFINNIEKNFNVRRIRRIEDNAWGAEGNFLFYHYYLMYF